MAADYFRKIMGGEIKILPGCPLHLCLLYTHIQALKTLFTSHISPPLFPSLTSPHIMSVSHLHTRAQNTHSSESVWCQSASSLPLTKLEREPLGAQAELNKEVLKLEAETRDKDGGWGEWEGEHGGWR